MTPEQQEALKGSHRRKSSRYVRAAYFLLFIAVVSPIAAIFDSRPSFETIEVWFQRSGALTTVFALLATQMKAMGQEGLHEPGTWGDELKLAVLKEFDFRFKAIFWVAFILTVLGTIIWGYGDTIYRMLNICP